MIPEGELFSRDVADAKPAPKQRQPKPVQQQRSELDWFAWEALKMHYGATCYLPEVSEREIWEKSAQWIYDRFDRLGKAVLTGISTKDMQASIARCQNKHTHLDLAWSWLRPGTRSYVSYVKHLGSLAEVKAAQLEFIEGFDLGSRHWCGLCCNDFVEAKKEACK